MAEGKKFNLKELLNQRSEGEWERADTLDKELLRERNCKNGLKSVFTSVLRYGNQQFATDLPPLN